MNKVKAAIDCAAPLKLPLQSINISMSIGSILDSKILFAIFGVDEVKKWRSMCPSTRMRKQMCHSGLSLGVLLLNFSVLGKLGSRERGAQDEGFGRSHLHGSYGFRDGLLLSSGEFGDSNNIYRIYRLPVIIISLYRYHLFDLKSNISGDIPSGERG